METKKLLIAFYYMKVYSTENVNATSCHIDEKTMRKWSWKGINAIAGLDHLVVRSFVITTSFSSFIFLCILKKLCYNLRTCLYRFCLTTGKRSRIQTPWRFFPLMGQISQYSSKVLFGRAGVLINLKSLDFVMKLVSEFVAAISAGLTAHFLPENILT